MDLERAREFMRAHHRAVLATYAVRRQPQLSPVTVAVDDEGRVLISTRETAIKTRNLRATRARRCACSTTASSASGSRSRARRRSSHCPTRWTCSSTTTAGVSGEHPDWDDYRAAMSATGGSSSGSPSPARARTSRLTTPPRTSCAAPPAPHPPRHTARTAPRRPRRTLPATPPAPRRTARAAPHRPPRTLRSAPAPSALLPHPASPPGGTAYPLAKRVYRASPAASTAPAPPRLPSPGQPTSRPLAAAAWLVLSRR